MLIRVKINGIPNAADRTSWPFPTAALYGYDPVSGMAVFDVPDTDVPPNLPPAGSANRPNTPAGAVVTQVSPADLAAWKGALGARYPGWAGQFNPLVQ